MASFRMHGNRWQARVNRKGHPAAVRSFLTRQDAERWARSIEIEMDRGSFVSHTEAQRTTLGELVERYMKEVTPTLKGAKEDLIRLTAMKRNPLCQVSATALTPARLAKYRDERLASVSAGTVIRELAYLSSIINHARREWALHIQNPVTLVKKPTSPKGRERILSQQEQTRLFDAVQPTGRRSPWLLPIVRVALETAMRRGELLALQWKHVNLQQRVAVLETTKNGDRRVVPLSSKAVETLATLPHSIDGRVFPMTACAVSAAFDSAAVRACLTDLRFHDLRHTAITQMADKLPNVIELSAVTGHKSLKMLQRYYHPSAQDLAKKLG